MFMSRDSMTEKCTEVVVIATLDELTRMYQSGEIDGDTTSITLTQLFDVLLEYYGYDPYFPPNDVY